MVKGLCSRVFILTALDKKYLIKGTRLSKPLRQIIMFKSCLKPCRLNIKGRNYSKYIAK